MRRATVTLCLCAICVACLTLPVFGGGMGTLGVGAKAKAMGGAFRAIADDWSAAYYNPAGLFYVTDNQFTINEVFTHFRYKYEPKVTYSGYPVGFYDGEIYNRYEILSNPTLGGFFKLPLKGRDFAFGLTIFQPFDHNVSWEVYHPLNNSHYMPGRQIEHNFDAVAFNGTVAVELIENQLSFGISGGVLKADLVYGGFFLRPNPADPDAVYYDNLVSRPNELITEWQTSDGNGLGANLRGGLLYRPTPKLSVGLSYAMKSTVTVEGESFFYYYLPDIFEYYNYSEEVSNPDSINALLSSGARPEAYADFEAEITMPAQLGFGLAYRVNDRLIVAGDLEYTFWSDFDGYVFEYDFRDSSITQNDVLNQWLMASMSVPVDWKNSLSGSVGMQYDYTDAVKLRAGYGLDRSPVEEGTLNPAFFDPGLKHRFNLGLGLTFESITIDLATEYIHYPESTEGSNVDLNGDDIMDNMAGTYSGSAFESVVQFTVRF